MRNVLSALVFLCLLSNAVLGSFTNQCLKCICEVEGCASQLNKCRMDVGSLSCGPYQIKSPYYTDCSRGKTDWQQCTKQMTCSENCVRSYMARYAAGCSSPRQPTCQDYARVHNGGPSGCKRSSTAGYWKKVNACCLRHGGC